MSLPQAARNTVIQLIGRVFSTLFGIVALAAVTRYLGQEGFGWYTTVFTFLQFFGILSDFGLTLITAQMLAEPGADEEKLLANLFSFRLILSGIFFGAACVSVWFFPYPAIIKWGVLVLSLSFYATTLQNIFVGFYQKHLRMEKVAWGDAIGRFIILVGYILVVWQKWSLLPILAMSVLANVTQFFWLWYAAKRLIHLRWEVTWLVYKEIFKRSWPVAISIAFNLIYLKADILVLSLARTQQEVGLYGAAYRIIDVLTTVPAMFMGIMLPLLTFAWSAGDKETFKHYFRRAYDMMFLLALPAVFGGVYLAKPLMIFLAGAEFADSGVFLQVLLLASAAIFLAAVSAHAVIAVGKQRAIIWWYVLDATLSLAGYIILIPRYGALAAAWVTVFSEVFIAVATFITVFKVIGAWPQRSIFLKSLLASVLMVIIISLLPALHIIFICLIAVIIYFVVLYLTKGITKEMVLEMVKKS
ncbi:MAG: flippase [Patescibacteria group bacterium]